MQSFDEKQMPDILEEINCSKSISNIWNDLYKELSPLKRFLYIPSGSFIRCRLIGSIIDCKRTFVSSPANCNLVTYIGIKEFKKLCKGDEETFSNLLKKIANDINKPKGIEELLIRIFDKNKWQKCFLSNVFVMESNSGDIGKSVYTYAFPQSLYKQLILAVFSKNQHNVDIVSGCRISGLFAHDITIRNLGKTLQNITTTNNQWNQQNNTHNKDNYNITISDTPSHLSKEEITTILRLGLNDLKEMCIRNNRSFLKRAILKNIPGGILYDIVSECKETDQVCQELISHKEFIEAQNIAQEHIQCVEQQLNDFPPEVFEKKKHDETITSLEL